MLQTEEKYKHWKKDIAYLKDIDAYDFKDSAMISILLDFLPDEAHKEITTKHETVGSKASTLRHIQIEVEKIIQREKDRAVSRKDRKPSASKNIALASESCGHEGHREEETLYIWGVHIGPSQ